MGKPRVAFVVQRCGDDVRGGAERLCLQHAAHMMDDWACEILTTCARDTTTWRNDFPAGETTIGGVAARRFPVARERDPVSFHALSRRVAGGAATKLFEALDEGGQIEASGPYGRFCLMPADANKRYLLIGTGTGVTPYRAMLSSIERQMAARNIEVVLLFGARRPEELIYAEDFQAFAAKHPGFRFVPCFSRELPADPHPDVRKGYVQDALAEFAPDPATDIAYLCGNPLMVDTCFEALKGYGLPVPAIRREKYVSSK